MRSGFSYLMNLIHSVLFHLVAHASNKKHFKLSLILLDCPELGYVVRFKNEVKKCHANSLATMIHKKVVEIAFIKVIAKSVRS